MSWWDTHVNKVFLKYYVIVAGLSFTHRILTKAKQSCKGFYFLKYIYSYWHCFFQTFPSAKAKLFIILIPYYDLIPKLSVVSWIYFCLQCLMQELHWFSYDMSNYCFCHLITKLQVQWNQTNKSQMIQTISSRGLDDNFNWEIHFMFLKKHRFLKSENTSFK